MKRIPVVDLFAGPGGLGEGFAQFQPSGKSFWPFEIALSAEFNQSAWRTLRLRTLYRTITQTYGWDSDAARCYWEYVSTAETFWRNRQRRDASILATSESLLEMQRHFESAIAESNVVRTLADKVGPRPIELGTPAGDQYVRHRLRSIKNHDRDWLLLGGPPCPTYSLAGRSRMMGENPEKYFADHRHHLYENYLAAVRDFQPAIFVMENVTGILSSKDPVDKSRLIFDRIVHELERPRGSRQLYDLYSFTGGLVTDDRRKFVIRAEEYGIPQARHRVIVLGIRRDRSLPLPELLQPILDFGNGSSPTVGSVIGSLPRLRSGVSLKKGDLFDTADFDGLTWSESINKALHRLAEYRQLPEATLRELSRLASQLDDSLPTMSTDARSKDISTGNFTFAPDGWFRVPSFGKTLNHETRTHMPTDLVRYLFAASFAKKTGRSPNLHDFDDAGLLPEHENVKGKSNKKDFADRFRVQLSNRPSTTVFSHISKDGHYFIHPDPTQCRSLTVREAARLQTFPDDYFFEGPRTDQYHQVGNAVPPLLALQLAKIVYGVMS